MVRVLYGNYLSRKGQLKEAVAHYEQARELAQNSANVHYNLGLAYFNQKDYEQALATRVRHPKPEFRGFSGMNRQQINQLGFSSEILCSGTKFSMTP